MAPATEDAADAELRSHIPASIVSTCRRATDAEPGSVAAFNCTYRRIVGLQYNLFATSAEMEEGYRVVKRRYGLAGATPGESCARGGFEGDYKPEDRVVGHVLCFIDDDVAAIVWTHDELDILSFAYRDDKNLVTLFEAWRAGVGPDR
jgi:hypothetical protein